MMRHAALFALLALFCLPGTAIAQSKTRLWTLQLGTPVADLPKDEWVDPSCGTNGGPPSTRLSGFEDFARCRVEPATGLREIWFIYDDEWEYVARAYRDEMEIMSFSANVFYAQPIITSLLVDEAGLVQGYRVITDPRAVNPLRREAFGLYLNFRTLFSQAPWQCQDLPPADRETPVDGRFIKSSCVMVSDELYVTIEGRLLRRPGQDTRDVAGMTPMEEGNFDSSARLDVYARQSVVDAPCCAAGAQP